MTTSSVIQAKPFFELTRIFVIADALRVMQYLKILSSALLNRNSCGRDGEPRENKLSLNESRQVFPLFILGKRLGTRLLLGLVGQHQTFFYQKNCKS
ncbi:hypothetical protein METHB2_10049 [Candidatus Methylobacter favarea]|uniref:Uncharacterized protein n=1 Tax=Candidatus Methylobacter favarea TaxID=2707345 RepID=A0A8S0WGI5_9GAMM|nr:hypothetical protein METHB2_10049 [Candidatus Methylobacter favarea]